MNRGPLKEIAEELPALFTIIGVMLAIVCGLLLGGYITTKCIEYLVQSLFQ